MNGLTILSIVVLPLILTLWAYAALRDFTDAYRSRRPSDADNLLPADNEGLNRYVRQPAVARVPRWTVRTLQVVFERQRDAVLEPLRVRYLLRLAIVLVAWLASFAIMVMLMTRY